MKRDDLQEKQENLRKQKRTIAEQQEIFQQTHNRSLRILDENAYHWKDGDIARAYSITQTDLNDAYIKTYRNLDMQYDELCHEERKLRVEEENIEEKNNDTAGDNTR